MVIMEYSEYRNKVIKAGEAAFNAITEGQTKEKNKSSVDD